MKQFNAAWINTVLFVVHAQAKQAVPLPPLRIQIMVFPQQQILYYYGVANKAAGVSQQMEVKKKIIPLRHHPSNPSTYRDKFPGSSITKVKF